jgi:hypothetical protein
MLTPIIAGLGGVAFLFAALFIVRDRRDAENNIECKYKLQDFYIFFYYGLFL